jgi:Bacterial mobilisation protein (MobC).
MTTDTGPAKPARTGRPRKQAAERRTIVYAIRLTPEERAEIDRRAAAVGVEASDYGRAMLLTGRVVQRHNVTFPAPLLHDLARVGNNLNQLAKHLNAGRAASPAAIEATRAELADLLDRMQAHVR